MNKREGSDDSSAAGFGHQFTETDLKVFERYLTFCGIGIQNAQLFEVSILEYKKNKLLLSLARGLFTEQRNLQRLIFKIISEAKDLLRCERCTVYLLDLKTEHDLIFNHGINHGGSGSGGNNPQSPGPSIKSTETS